MKVLLRGSDSLSYDVVGLLSKQLQSLIPDIRLLIRSISRSLALRP